MNAYQIYYSGKICDCGNPQPHAEWPAVDVYFGGPDPNFIYQMPKGIENGRVGGGGEKLGVSIDLMKKITTIVKDTSDQNRNYRFESRPDRLGFENAIVNQ